MSTRRFGDETPEEDDNLPDDGVQRIDTPRDADDIPNLRGEASILEMYEEEFGVHPSIDALKKLLLGNMAGKKVKLGYEKDGELIEHEDELLEGKIIGKGSFGIVLKLVLKNHDIQIAFKVVDDQEELDVNIALFEKFTLETIKKNPNVPEDIAPTPTNFGLKTGELTRLTIEGPKGVQFDLSAKGIPMQYFEGALTLNEYLAKTEYQDPGKYLEEIFLPMAEKLKLLLDNDIVHLDIKPENFLITPQGQVIFIDFGMGILIVDDELIFPDPDIKNELIGSPPYTYPFLSMVKSKDELAKFIKGTHPRENIEFYKKSALWSFYSMMLIEMFHVSPMKIQTEEEGEIHILEIFRGRMAKAQKVLKYYESLNFGNLDMSIIHEEDLLEALKFFGSNRNNGIRALHKFQIKNIATLMSTTLKTMLGGCLLELPLQTEENRVAIVGSLGLDRDDDLSFMDDPVELVKKLLYIIKGEES